MYDLNDARRYIAITASLLETKSWPNVDILYCFGLFSGILWNKKEKLQGIMKMIDDIWDGGYSYQTVEKNHFPLAALANQD